MVFSVVFKLSHPLGPVLVLDAAGYGPGTLNIKVAAASSRKSCNIFLKHSLRLNLAPRKQVSAVQF